MYTKHDKDVHEELLAPVVVIVIVAIIFVVANTFNILVHF